MKYFRFEKKEVRRHFPQAQISFKDDTRTVEREREREKRARKIRSSQGIMKVRVKAAQVRVTQLIMGLHSVIIRDISIICI